jgi:pyruvate-formate lyase-activating enzyme
MDAVTADLKGLTPEFYWEVSASRLQPVRRTPVQVHRSAAHLEIANLMGPTLNDGLYDVRSMCRWIRDTLDEVGRPGTVPGVSPQN